MGLKKPLTRKQKERTKNMEYKYGYFNESGDEFVITAPNTPRPFDNFLFNDACYANVHQTGIGCFDYQINGTEGIQLYTGVGRICDYDVFGKDHLYNRLIFIRDNETGEFWTLNWEPDRKSTRLNSSHVT